MDILLEILLEMTVEGVSQGSLCAKLPRSLRMILAGLTITGLLAAAALFLFLSLQMDRRLLKALFLGLALLCAPLLYQYLKKLRRVK